MAMATWRLATRKTCRFVGAVMAEWRKFAGFKEEGVGGVAVVVSVIQNHLAVGQGATA